MLSFETEWEIFLKRWYTWHDQKRNKKKFNEIVDFAGLERCVDTPVNRYSIGMYVRIAFGLGASSGIKDSDCT